MSGTRRSPWSFVPTLYVLQAIPYFAVFSAANTFLAAVGVPTGRVTRLSSDLILPWSFKPLWSPLVDLFGSKRTWLVASALATVLAMLGLAYATTSTDLVGSVSIACLAIAVAGATNDIATDGYYIHALEKTDQELFVGVRTAAHRLGRVLVLGGAVSLAGWLSERGGYAPGKAWSVAFLACAALYAVVTLWHMVWLPRPVTDASVREGAGAWSALLESLRAYFGKPRIAGAIVFIFFYRVAEVMLAPTISPFLLAPRSAGGAGLTVSQVGWLTGTVGVVALVAGGLLGGFIVARFGLRRCLLPMALCMHAPNLLYVWAAHVQPGIGGMIAVVGVEQLGYGAGLTAYFAALLALSRGTRHSTTHYAISTGLMALSVWVFGRYTGDVVERVGYERFFWIVSAAGLLGLATLPLCPRESGAARTGESTRGGG
jgi:PAT family beta-lactamase induction signal transducer AmpG